MAILDFNTEKVENLHTDSGHMLVTAADIYVPWYKCFLKCKYQKLQSMSELDKIFCMCVDRGIDNPDDISFVLSLEKEICIGELENLSECGILTNNNNLFSFTDFGISCYRTGTKAGTEIDEIPLFINSITGELSLSNEIQFLSKPDASSISLTPIKSIDKGKIEKNNDLYNTLSGILGTKNLQFQFLEQSDVVYYSEKVIFYQNDNNKRDILIDIYDSSLDKIDFNLSGVLRNKYEKREILELMQAEKHLDIVSDALIDSLEKTHPDISFNPYRERCQFLRNKEIRELFLCKLEESQNHIFIISPWINSFVVDEKMISKFQAALNRDVKIDIGFGYVSYEKMNWILDKYSKRLSEAVNNDSLTKKILEEKEHDKEMQSWEMAQMLKERFYNDSNFNIFYIKEGTHEKIMCYDDKKVIIGSYNLLSYDGGEQENYSGFKFRLECGVLIDDPSLSDYIMNTFAPSMIKL